MEPLAWPTSPSNGNTNAGRTITEPRRPPGNTAIPNAPVPGRWMTMAMSGPRKPAPRMSNDLAIKVTEWGKWGSHVFGTIFIFPRAGVLIHDAVPVIRWSERPRGIAPRGVREISEIVLPDGRGSVGLIGIPSKR